MMSAASLKTIQEQLIQHEGLRLLPYKDSVGRWTIGVGRNLDDVGISKSEALYLLDNDIGRVCVELDQALPWWRGLDLIRQQVLIDLGFNLGVLTPPETAKLLTFERTLALIRTGQYVLAADNLTTTLWHTQVGSRALDLEAMLRMPVDA
jgi:lysozyme